MSAIIMKFTPHPMRDAETDEYFRCRYKVLAGKRLLFLAAPTTSRCLVVEPEGRLHEVLTEYLTVIDTYLGTPSDKW